MSPTGDATLSILAIVLVFGGVIWALLLIRRLDRMIEQNLADNGRAIHQLQKLDRQFASARQDFQKLGSQIDAVATELKNVLSASAAASVAAAERHAEVVNSLREHDAKYEHIANALTNISETLTAKPQGRSKNEETGRESGLSKWRRDVLSQDPALRFSVLWEWCSVNMLGILHRASRGWNSTNDLTANIPAYLEPEADVLNNSVLIIGTRQHPERLAIPLRPLEESSDFQSWFESLPENPAMTSLPALVMRSNGHFKLLARGTNSSGLTH